MNKKVVTLKKIVKIHYFFRIFLVLVNIHYMHAFSNLVSNNSFMFIYLDDEHP